MRRLRPWIVTLSKLCFGTYFILTSLYCLLAFIPYTYFFLVKEPPSPALIAFVHYHSLFYWLALGACLLGYWEQRKRWLTLAAWALLTVIGTIFSAKNFLPHIQNNWVAYASSMVVLLPLLSLASGEIIRGVPDEPRETRASLLSYSNGLIAVLIIAAFSAEALPIKAYCDATASGFWSGLVHAGVKHDLKTVKLASLIVANYLWLAALAVSVINLTLFAATRITRRPQLTRALLLSLVAFAAIFLASFRFLENMLNLHGWTAGLYATVFAASVTLWGVATTKSVFAGIYGTPFSKKIAPWVIGGSFAFMALVVPMEIADTDWNGVAQNAFTLLFWVVVCVSVYLARPRAKSYSLAAMVAVLLVAAVSYQGIITTAFLWARPVGKTDDEIRRAMESYAAQNVSYNLAYHWLDGGTTEPCQDLCLTLRQYTNIRDAEIDRQVSLVDSLTPATGPRPNILIVVVDSMRADYLGAYNPKVDFTPNLDEFARDSVVMRHAFTPYAGTTLAEPCIWTGSLLLHAHYVHPFEKVNTLERLLETDSYQMILSYDSVLRQVLPENVDAIKLDTDRPWNHFEATSTFHQLESVLDKRQAYDRPFFFYAQPMNVHQFGVNDRPVRSSSNWVMRPGFENWRAYKVHQVDESFGELFGYLKSKGLYDNSIIIVTADHGEGTEELGHHAHSTVIYPEVMHVPLIIHLPTSLRTKMAYNDAALASLIDITPSLYTLLGHGPVEKGPLLGRPMFAETNAELESYPRADLLLASDVRAAYGLLSGDGRYMYVTYDSPAQSYLYDLVKDPDATQSFFTEDARKKYERRLIEYLQIIADFYGYKPNGNRVLLATQ